MITGGQETIEGYNEKAARFIIKAFEVFRERGTAGVFSLNKLKYIHNR
jgi:hypothetical protein